jgi:hypothetical protein
MGEQNKRNTPTFQKFPCGYQPNLAVIAAVHSALDSEEPSKSPSPRLHPGARLPISQLLVCAVSDCNVSPGIILEHMHNAS